MAALGPVPERAGLGHGARGLQRRRRRLGLLPARPRPLARLPLERGRPGRASATTAQTLCLALALWNGRDPILKERIFGLTGTEGNHGEDAKEYWWYLDATPTHSWMRWRYHYPQARVPVRASSSPRTARRGRLEPEYELLDTGVFDDDRYWDDHRRLRQGRARRPAACASRVAQRRPGRGDARTCCRRCGSATPGRGGSTGAAAVDRGSDGRRARRRAPARSAPLALAGERRRPSRCSARTRRTRARLFGVAAGDARTRRTASTTTSSHGAATVNPAERGTKAAVWYRVDASPPGETVERARSGSRPSRAGAPTSAPTSTPSLAARRGEADEFYAALRPPARSRRRGAACCARRFAGMLWRKQFYHYDVARWLDGDPAQPAAARQRAAAAATPSWRTSTTLDVISMPDKWEYPWFAAWDLAFHCVALAHVDPAFAKDQLLLLLPRVVHAPERRSCPAYEWDFGDVNPPVHAWAALQVFEIDGGTRPRLPRAASSTSC